MSKPEKPFIALNIAILTVSDTRSLEEDTSGKYLADSLVESGHTLAERAIRTDDIYQIRAIVSQWIADPAIHAIITTGGTGFYIRDQIPEALSPLFDKEVQGFGEMFRALSRDEIGMSTLPSFVQIALRAAVSLQLPEALAISEPRRPSASVLPPVSMRILPRTYTLLFR